MHIPTLTSAHFRLPFSLMARPAVILGVIAGFALIPTHAEAIPGLTERHKKMVAAAKEAHRSTRVETESDSGRASGSVPGSTASVNTYINYYSNSLTAIITKYNDYLEEIKNRMGTTDENLTGIDKEVLQKRRDFQGTLSGLNPERSLDEVPEDFVALQLTDELNKAFQEKKTAIDKVLATFDELICRIQEKPLQQFLQDMITTLNGISHEALYENRLSQLMGTLQKAHETFTSGLKSHGYLPLFKEEEGVSPFSLSLDSSEEEGETSKEMKATIYGWNREKILEIQESFNYLFQESTLETQKEKTVSYLDKARTQLNNALADYKNIGNRNSKTFENILYRITYLRTQLTNALTDLEYGEFLVEDNIEPTPAVLSPPRQNDAGKKDIIEHVYAEHKEDIQNLYYTFNLSKLEVGLEKLCSDTMWKLIKIGSQMGENWEAKQDKVKNTKENYDTALTPLISNLTIFLKTQLEAGNLDQTVYDDKMEKYSEQVHHVNDKFKNIYKKINDMKPTSKPKKSSCSIM